MKAKTWQFWLTGRTRLAARRRMSALLYSSGRRALLVIFATAFLCLSGKPQAAITISPSSLPNWTVQSPYLQTLTATGCTISCTWSSSGKLPSGLSLSSVNGTISGTPSATGAFQFTVTATDLLSRRGSQAYSVTINAVPAFSTTSLPDATAGTPYSQAIQVSNGTPPYTFSVASGALPSGLSLNASSGVISGTTTGTGSSTFSIAVGDAANATASQAYTLKVDAASISISTGAVLPGGTVGSMYSQTLAASGGMPPYTWAVSGGALPGGLTLNSSTGVLSGNPIATGTFLFTAQVTDANHATGSKQFTVTIAASGQPLSITTGATLPGGTVGNSYSQTLAAAGGGPPYTWAVTAGTLPAGISLDAPSGTISGTPTAAGASNFTVQVTDSVKNNAAKAFSLTIAPGASSLAITTATPLPGATQGSAYSQNLTASGGKAPYTWSITTGALPSGLTLDGSGGTITGTPTTTGSFTFNLRVTDSSSATADLLASIAVAAASATPTLSITGVPTSAGSAAQVPIGVTLSAAYTKTVTGQVTLTFQPGGSAARDDPSIQFSTGGRTVNFTIAAGSTHATFSSATVAFQTGTVAGTIALAVSSDLSNGTASSTTVVAATAPTISSATVTTNSSGFQVQVAGYSNPRDLAGATFQFTANSGQILQTGSLTVNLGTLASQWYSGSTSSQFGGQFLLQVPFTVQQGATTGLSSVSVQLQNSQGTSAAASAKF
jgi:hypothetical protein